MASSGLGESFGGSRRVRRRSSTFSQTAGFSLTSPAFRLSTERLPLLRDWLWHVVQYFSNIGLITPDTFVCALAPAARTIDRIKADMVLCMGSPPQRGGH